MSARFCGECGTDVSSDDRFCSTCGTPNPAVQAPAPAPVTQPAFLASPPPPPPYVAPPPPPWAAPPPLAPAPSARRRTGLVVAAVVVVLAIVSGGLTVWLLNRGDDAGPGADRAGGLDVLPASIDNGVSVLGEPGRTWDFEADDVVNGGTLLPIDPNSSDELFLPTALPVGDTLVVAINDPDGDTDEQTVELVGLGADGSPQWQADGNEVGTACWAPDADHLLCTGYGTGLHVLDPDTGRVTGSSDLDPAYGLEPVVIGGVLYVVAQGSDVDGDDHGDGIVVAALDLDSLDERWSTDVPGSTSWELSEVGGDVDVVGDDVLVNIGDVGSDESHLVRLDRLTGAVQGNETNGTVSYDQYLQGQWRIDATYDEPVRVYLNDDLVLEQYGDLWYAGDGRVVVDGRIGVGGSLYDIATGEVVWSRDDLDGDTTSFQWSEDHDQVLVSGNGSTTALDAADGTTEWTYDGEFYGTTETRDAFVLGSSDPYSVIVIDRSTGEVAWTRDFSDLAGSPDDGEDSLRATVYRTGPSLTVVGFHGVRGYTDFPRASGGGQGGGHDDDDTAYVTACGAPPEFIPMASTTAYGGVAITYRVKATCAGGQWLNHSQLSVPFVVGGYSYASGYFDFSGDPYWIPEDGEDLELVYPFENTQVPESEIDQAIEDDGGTGKVVQVPCEPGPDNTEGAVPGDPSYGADPDDPTTADGAPDESSDEDRDETALEALQRIADEDQDGVEALGTDWTAQLSSKKPGTADDGKVYDSYDDILALHLQHRARYPSSLLVYSNDWAGSFGPSSQDYWVTLSGQSEATTRPILRWCKDEGWGLGDCWAKRLQHSGDPDLNTDKNKPDDRNN